MKTNDLIRMRRLELDMTMKELAAKVGVSEGTISRWESGDIENMKLPAAGVEPARSRLIYLRIGLSCQDACQVCYI